MVHHLHRQAEIAITAQEGIAGTFTCARRSIPRFIQRHDGAIRSLEQHILYQRLKAWRMNSLESAEKVMHEVVIAA